MATIWGDPGPDTIVGTADGDNIYGWAGNDSLSGAEGNDTLSHEGGAHITMDGGDGDDVIDVPESYTASWATMLGGAGADLITAIKATVTIDAGPGDDYIALDYIFGSTITLGLGADRVSFVPRPGYPALVITDFQTGDAGDRVTIPNGVTLIGWDGSTNPFTLNYYRLLQQGADTVLQWDRDGAGLQFGLVDLVRFQNTNAGQVTAHNVLGWSPMGVQPVDGVYEGTNGEDVYSGTTSNEAINGGAGYDRLFGQAGDDTIDGGAGDDTLDGGPGADRVFGGDGADQIWDAGGSNYLRGDEGNDVLHGGAGFDDINGNMGNDAAYGGLGDDWVVGGKDADWLSGGDGADIVYGNMGSDTCSGGVGADLVRGGQDSDVVLGEEGNDWLSGDRGDDTVTGGPGADTFHTFGEAGIDRVTDFNLIEGDRVMLDPGTTYSLAQVGADTVITMGGGGQMILVGVQLSSLTPGWIFGG